MYSFVDNEFALHNVPPQTTFWSLVSLYFKPGPRTQYIGAPIDRISAMNYKIAYY